MERRGGEGGAGLRRLPSSAARARVRGPLPLPSSALRGAPALDFFRPACCARGLCTPQARRWMLVDACAQLDALARLLVTYGVDDHAVRAAVAGSSALLSVYFERTVASGGRWRYYELPDPEPEAVLRELRAHGYTAAEAEDMVALCGTRLRLLEEPLTCGASAVGARAFMDAACAPCRGGQQGALRSPRSVTHISVAAARGRMEPQPRLAQRQRQVNSE